MEYYRTRRITLAPCILVAMMTGCGGTDGAGSGDLDPAATVVVDGSSTVFRISRAAKEAFRKEKPEWLVVVDNHGTGGGFGRYLRNEVDIVDASRPARPAEEARAREQGIDWTRFVVGY
ncbi:MAG: substrate-binding domain-containing protein, partial [Isosphaeraceae bacterium]